MNQSQSNNSAVPSAEVIDAQIRCRIEEELDKNFMVEAAAGTGKTTSIVNRMANLVATGTCQIQHLAAVTFTRKAAAELRERFQAELRRREAALSQSNTMEGQASYLRLKTASDYSNLAFVGTIHSFCATLLRERPIEFDVDPSFRELDETQDLELREQAWLLNIADLIAVNDPLIHRLSELGLDRKQLKDRFDRFIEYRDITDWPTGTSEDFDLNNAKKLTRDYIRRIEKLASLFPSDRGSDELMNQYDAILRANSRAWNSPASFIQLLEQFDSTRKITQKQWHDANVAKAEKSEFDRFRALVAKPALQSWYRIRYEFVVDFLRRAVAVYEKLKRTTGGLGFSDLLIAASQGLKCNPNLRHYFQRRFTHLLVDEFQDTDPIQAEMILYLTSEDCEQSAWQLCSPRSGALFLVGDPKQSIYRFRRGDIVTYNRMKDVFLRSGGEVLKLVKNFRSIASIIEWNNRIFNEKFLAQSDNYQAASESMLLGRVDVTSGNLFGLHKLPVSTDLKIDEATRIEADSIARFIRYAIDSRMTVPRTKRELQLGLTKYIEARDFLIIPRGKKHLQSFKLALERYDIPSKVNGSNAFVGIHELELLIDCLRAIDDVHNPVHFLAILRERLFGFSDVDLYEFRRAGGTFSFASPIPLQLAEELRARFEDANRRLGRYQGWLRVLPFTVAVSRIAEDLGLIASAASESDGNNRAGGLLRAIESLRQQSYLFDSASDLISYFEQLLKVDETEGCTALPPDANVVRVMNLHKAKGLEAPVVFLADTSPSYKGSPQCHISRTSNYPVGYMGITRPNGIHGAIKEVATPPNWDEHQREEQRFLDAESDRLIYVATTRAACMLVVSVGKDQSNWKSLHSYLHDVADIKIPSDSQLKKVAHNKQKLNTKSSAEPVLKRQAEENPLEVTQTKDKWTAALQPSYYVASAKELGLKGTSRPRWDASGDYGYKWGSAIHDLLEIAKKVPQAIQRASAVRLANEYSLGSDRVDELLSTVQSVTQSVIWKRARTASRCFSELPFESSSNDEAGKLTIIRGVIDLIFEEAVGWVIVDYKTDDINESDVSSAVNYYRGQIEKYADHWRSATGFRTSELGLYFTRINRYVGVATQGE